jgi:hypothetical protein
MEAVKYMTFNMNCALQHGNSTLPIYLDEIQRVAGKDDPLYNRCDRRLISALRTEAIDAKFGKLPCFGCDEECKLTHYGYTIKFNELNSTADTYLTVFRINGFND